MSYKGHNSRGRRKRRSKLAVGSLSALAIIVLLLISVGLFFKISEVRVEGTNVINPNAVRETANIQLNSNIFLMNKFRVSNVLFKAFPYAERITITRKLPSIVVITIEEAVPACAFEFEGYYWHANSQGRILSNTAAVGNLNYPVIKGATLLAPSVGTRVVFSLEEKEKEYALFPLITALEQTGLISDVSEVDCRKAYDISFLYKNRLTVRIGLPKDLEYKLSYIEIAMAQLADDQKATLDLSAAMDKNVLLLPD